MRIIGIDPGLRRTGWGVVDKTGSRLQFVAAGVIAVPAEPPTAERLAELFRQVSWVLDEFNPTLAAVEETFVNSNSRSSLTLAQARAIALIVPALRGLAVKEYATNLVKKSIVGNGHATKEQVQMMVARLLPKSGEQSFDAADALAVAITAAHLEFFEANFN
ncbi:MAG: crossover junction endodeoxyribonuclease RuvC [Candidatus Pacebacteria bacterium]|nr:crossover junction endodeoxyribonuclease RuvC [Candidatus Paceibacterota bacterium]